MCGKHTRGQTKELKDEKIGHKTHNLVLTFKSKQVDDDVTNESILCDH